MVSKLIIVIAFIILFLHPFSRRLRLKSLMQYLRNNISVYSQMASSAVYLEPLAHKLQGKLIGA